MPDDEYEFLEDASREDVAHSLSTAVCREQALDLALTLLEDDYP